MSRSCQACGRSYAYDVPSCTFCGVPLERTADGEALVIAVTEVATPSLGHEDAPYWCALVRADDGTQAVLKLDRPVDAGSTVSLGGPEPGRLATVGVLGTGVMGRGLVELLLARGHRVAWCGRSPQRVAASRARVFDRLARVLDDDQIDAAAARLTASADLGVLGECDVVIEAVVEELGPKAAALREAEAAMRDDAVLATNTSGLPLDDLAAALRRPERFGGLHFFNPPTRMRLVETAVAAVSSAETSAFLDDFALAVGKVPVRVAAKPAFVVNRVLMPLLNEAVRALEEEVAPAESIDEAVRLGLNHPMGPLALADLIGLDVVVDIMDNLAGRTGDETYEPRPMLRRLVAEGRLGRKTGAGFYEYPARPTG